MTVQTLDCRRCGMQWEREVQRGSNPHTCPTCKPMRGVRGPGTRTRRLGTYDAHATVVRYRLAIEMATAALRMNRRGKALAALESVQAPTRDIP